MTLPRKNDQLIAALAPYFVRRPDPAHVFSVSGAVSNPPTAAELNSLLDSPGNLAADTLYWVDDSGSSRSWLCFADGSNWWYVLFTQAV